MVRATEQAFTERLQALSAVSPKASDTDLFESVTATLIFELGKQQAVRVGLPPEALVSSRLAASLKLTTRLTPLEQMAYQRGYQATLRQLDSHIPPAILIGAVYESLVALHQPSTSGARRSRQRKQSGSYYTPPELAASVVTAAFDTPSPGDWSRLKILDPAVGAGVFLIQACEHMSHQLSAGTPGLSPDQARAVVATHCLYGVDVNPLSVAVAELCLWLYVADANKRPDELGCHLRPGDALVGYGFERADAREAAKAQLVPLVDAGLPISPFDFSREFPDVTEGFDIVLGNPPWVAYAGRSAQPLAPQLRSYYRQVYAAWKGFPTLHGLFVERAAQLAPRGSVALLLPSPVADLDGYRSVRARLTRSHRVRNQLTEFGQDAFAGVTQPCFALVADASPNPFPSEERWPLSERQWADGGAEAVAVPAVLALLSQAPRLAPSHFREVGFQTTRLASETLLLRGRTADHAHRVALLEGRNVSEFHEGPPQLFLRADPELLKQVGCRLRAGEEYATVDFVVRQTASVPIAALHGNFAFRNSLLGGFGADGMSAELLVALLNSSLYRALHLAGQRDARQAAFPQVKIGHLRALPRPPRHARIWRRLEKLTLRMTRGGVSSEARLELDACTFELFGVPEDHRRAVCGFLKARAPRYAPADASVPSAGPTSALDPVRRALAL